MELADLKARILALLREDLEFRYAVAGMLGLDEILRRLEKHDEKFEEILKRLDRHEAELVRLREDMIAGFRRHDEILERHAQEIAKLREDFNEMLKVITQLQEEQRRLREGHERLEKYADSLEKSLARLEERLKSLESAMISGFADMSKFAGVTFEEFVRGFLTYSLRGSGEIPEGVELRREVVDGEEMDLFLEDPLIVGEVTASAESVEEMAKLLRKAELVRAKYSREPKKILVALTASKDVAREMRRIAEEKGVELVIGRVVG